LNIGLEKNTAVKKYLFISLISILFFACREKPKSISESEPIGIEIHPELYGSWTGDIYEDEEIMEFIDKLNINIKRITKDSVIAQSILAGKITSLTGNLVEENGRIMLVLHTDKSQKADGSYKLELKKDTLIGTWKPYKPNKAENLQFKLVKREIAYDAKLMLPDDYSFIDWQTYKSVKITDTAENGEENSYDQQAYRSPSDQIFKLNASTMALKEVDLKNLRKLDMEIIRNTIFARHGYAFKNAKIRQFFDPIPWYVPLKENIEQELTALEKANIVLLSKFEKYATDNYDAYGR
jgi:hypothetical protein